MKKIPAVYYVVSVALFAVVLAGCHSAKNNENNSDNVQVDMHSKYDDSTLANNILPVLMPYNRLIDPAGKVVSFGDPKYENHSMDVKLIPNSPMLAVEDRYGIALIDTQKRVVEARWTYNNDKNYKGMMSTYSGLKVLVTNNEIEIFWSAAISKSGGHSKSLVLQAVGDGQKISIRNSFSFDPKSPSPLALPNDLVINNEGGVNYLYVVLNGNDQLVKINLSNNSTVWIKQTGVAPYGITMAQNKIFVSNWAGSQPTDTINRETAGVPYGKTYIDPKTGATAEGSVSVFDPSTGNLIKEILVGLHPNALISSPDQKFVYVANGNSDYVSVINTGDLRNADDIPVRLIPGKKSFIGDTPNALATNAAGTTLYVANGMDNAVAVVKLGSKASAGGHGKDELSGFIPTEAYPGGLEVDKGLLFVTNLEGEGARVSSLELNQEGKGRLGEVQKSGMAGNAPSIQAYSSHFQKATVSIIPLPGAALLNQYTKRVKYLNFTFREALAQLLPRKTLLQSLCLTV